MKSITKSWQTTLAGILQFLSVIATQFGYLVDMIPETQPDWGAIVASAVILFGLIKARDNGVSSEDAGATKAQEGELAERVRALERKAL